MKIIISFFFCIFFAFTSAHGQEFETFEFTEGDTTFIMKKYYLLTYYAGENRRQSEEERAEIQKGHLAHLNRLAEDKKICVAGPFDGDGDTRGLVIFSVYSQEEAEELSRKDPAVQAGRLRFEIKPFWAAKGSTLF